MSPTATHRSSYFPAFNQLLRPCEDNTARLLLSGLAALAITLGLAALMNALIGAQTPQISSATAPSPFTVQSIELAPIVPPTQEPNTAPPPPTMSPSPATPDNPLRIPAERAPFSSESDLAPLPRTPSIPLGPPGTMAPSSPAVRRSAAPTYPIEARQAGVEGFVRVRYTIASDGSVTNIHILESSPRNTFDSSVLHNLQRARFMPAMEDGRPISTTVEEVYDFRMDG